MIQSKKTTTLKIPFCKDRKGKKERQRGGKESQRKIRGKTVARKDGLWVTKEWEGRK